MDDEDFDDLLAGVEMISGSSQESLTDAAANLDIDITTPQSFDPRGNQRYLNGGIAIEHCNASGAEESTPNQGIEPCPSPKGQPSPPLTSAEQIESIFKRISDALTTEGSSIFITLQTKPSAAAEGSRPRRIEFPGKTSEEAWRFTVVMRIMELIHEAIRLDVVLSKRDVYYRDPALFGNQAVVNRYVDSIAYTLNVPRAMLHVTAAAKGLVAGAFRICRRDGSMVDARGEQEGMLIPMLKDILSIDMSAVKWILVVEKEASFRSIVASSFWQDVSTRGVIMTGKGYPDIATRALLHFMTTTSPQNGFASPPVSCLVDFDPDGMAIMATYKYGSAALAHENEGLRVPQMQWLGLRSEYLTRGAGELHSDQGILTLTPRDRRKAVNMLCSSHSDADGGHQHESRNALQTMLMLNTKAELQLLDAIARGMVDLLTSALSDVE